MLITTPRYIIIEKNSIDNLENILLKLNLKNPLVICGNTTKKYIKKYNYNTIYYNEFKDIIYNNEKNSINIEDFKDLKDFDSIIGVGGGMAIDTGKYLAHILNKQFISIPTTASNDGIASPIIATFGKSIKGESPIAIIADLNIIEKSPKRLLSAGMGDIVSNITAVLDWELANKEINELYSDSSGIFSKTIAVELMDYVLGNNDLKEYSKKLLKALVGSGITIAIANSTRPASGSEHLFSHSLDLINRKNNNKIGIHGEQCGLGTIISSYLHYKEGNISKEEYINIKIALDKVGAPINGKQIGLDEDILIEALTNAHKIRNRYTIFRKGISKDKARNILENTYII